MSDRLSQATGRPRFQATLLAAFAAIGLLLAAIGLGGVMSFLVAQRSREIGVRMALGATPASIVRLTLAFAARSIAAGLIVGGAGAYVAARWLRSQLFQVPPDDPRPLAIAAALLVIVALIAAAGPARRAARVDPMTTLRGVEARGGYARPLFVAQSHQRVYAACSQRRNARSRQRDQKQNERHGGKGERV
jgi:putative ABC transport system permease protein